MNNETTASVTLAENSQRIEYSPGCPSLLHCLESVKATAVLAEQL